MKPLDILVNEHRIIEQVLHCLERMVERGQTEERLERGPAEDAVSFFRAFAECSHLAKEEIHLFAALEGAECPEGSRCKERMTHDKQQGRFHLGEMETAIEAASTGDKPALKRFVEHAGIYIGLLLKYIENEEDWLFPTAGQILTDGQQRVIAERLKTTETDGPCAGQEQKYVGAMPGRVIQAIRRAGVGNPMLMLDEVDKLCRDYRGDPVAALLEILDPAQNSQFRDNYLDLPVDLSKVFLITTANTLDTVPAPLVDRMEILRLSDYSDGTASAAIPGSGRRSADNPH